MHMLFTSFFSWWYGPGWKKSIHSIVPRCKNVMEAFSVDQLSKTLFAPWKKIISYPGRGVAEKFKAALDNLFSRCIGFVIRISVLFAAIITLIFSVILSVIEIIVWPLLPLAVPVLLIAAVFV